MLKGADKYLYRDFYVLRVCPELYKKKYYTIIFREHKNKNFRRYVEEIMSTHRGYYSSRGEAKSFIDSIYANYDLV